MREQLIQYVNLLFAGAPDSEEIRQEILQNTLDRYDDLVSQGKSPEAAYRLAITGIGDINEILSSNPQPHNTQPAAPLSTQGKEPVDTPLNKRFRAIAIGLYILCPIPLIVLSEFGSDMMSIIGLCGTLAFVAVATVIMIICKKTEPDDEERRNSTNAEIVSPSRKLRKGIDSVISSIGLAVYFVLSFTTGAWFITWLIFPIIGCINGLVNAIMDLKEA